MSTVVFENDDFLIANKDHGVPTVPLKNQTADGTLLGFVSSLCPEVLSVCGNNPWEGGALHRLDTATAGLVLFAKKQSFYDWVSKVQKEGSFEKTYIAECDEKQPVEDGRISSYFRAFGPGSKLVKAEQDVRKADSPTLYETYVKRVAVGTYECRLSRGFRHQIRVHLSSNGCPIKNDELYNPGKADGPLMLTCTGLEFPLPDGSEFTYNLQ